MSVSTALANYAEEFISDVVADPTIKGRLYNLGRQTVQEGVAWISKGSSPSAATPAPESWEAKVFLPVLTPFIAGAKDEASTYFTKVAWIGGSALVAALIASFLLGRASK